MNTLQYGTTKIDYEIFPHERKDLKISVDLVNGVMVYVPYSLDENKLHMMMQKKAPWILMKLNELNEIKHVNKKEYVSGEKLPYLGKNYKLKVHREAINKVSLTFFQGKFMATVPKDWNQNKVNYALEQKLTEWYKNHGIAKINERAEYYQNILGVSPNTINLRTQHKRWGTCTPEGNIYINWRITMAPVKIIDYIIVHELAHLIVPQHNGEFWNVVKSVLPDFEARKEWLRVNGVELHCLGYNKRA